MKKINASYKRQYTINYFSNNTPFDINNDGLLDFYCINCPASSYSINNRYFRGHREKFGSIDKKYIYQPKNLKCKVTLDKNYYYTDGENLYFKDISYKNEITICNLTKLTTQGGK